MIDHNLSQFSLNQDTEGEMVMPSEKGNITVQCNLRQFIIQARRAYSAAALENLVDSEDIKYTMNTVSGNYPVSDEVEPFFYVKLVAKPDVSLKEFAQGSRADAFFEKVLELAGRSNTRYKSGNRTAFLSSFNKEVDPNVGEVMVGHLLIGTSVFYNDYRVTVNYPSVDVEYTEVLKSLFEGLSLTFPEVEMEVSYETLKPVNSFSQALAGYF